MKKLILCAFALLCLGLTSCEEEFDPTKPYCWSFSDPNTGKVLGEFWGLESDTKLVMSQLDKQYGVKAKMVRNKNSESECGAVENELILINY